MKFARTDELTGIRNKMGTAYKIDSWLSSPDCCETQAFLMFDLDRFKQINDVYGHAVGDEVLQAVGALMKDYFRKYDILGRIGGDEFMVLMRDVATPEDAVHRAKGLCQKIQEMQLEALGDTQITCSIGLAFYPENGTTYEELYRCADQALYITKKNGRNGYTVYTPTDDLL